MGVDAAWYAMCVPLREAVRCGAPLTSVNQRVAELQGAPAVHIIILI